LWESLEGGGGGGGGSAWGGGLSDVLSGATENNPNALTSLVPRVDRGLFVFYRTAYLGPKL